VERLRVQVVGRTMTGAEWLKVQGEPVMTMQHLPRPWMLAALADVPVTLLARQNVRELDTAVHELAPPRPEERRRRLSTRPSARQWCHPEYGEEASGAGDRWRDAEVERAA
jgi:hypothetical protein